jgi:hypothetical protein
VKCKNKGCDNELPSYYEYEPNKWKNKDCATCRSLKHKYGITTPERNEMLIEQDYKCLGCNSKIEFNTQGYTNKHTAVIDHCHVSGNIRGILCGACNTLIGKAEDSPQILRNLANYLEERKTL